MSGSYSGTPINRIRNSHYPYLPGTPTASTDPKLRISYGTLPEAEWLEKQWFSNVNPIINATTGNGLINNKPSGPRMTTNEFYAWFTMPTI